MRKSVPEPLGSVFEDVEPSFDERAISPGLALVVTVEEVKRLVIPGAVVSPYQRTTAVPF